MPWVHGYQTVTIPSATTPCYNLKRCIIDCKSVTWRETLSLDFRASLELEAVSSATACILSTFFDTASAVLCCSLAACAISLFMPVINSIAVTISSSDRPADPAISTVFSAWT